MPAERRDLTVSVIKALKKAVLRERLPTGMIVHSDRGGQYVDTEFRGLLNQHGFEQSMSRADETYDNAHAESLFSRYKAELLEGGAFADIAFNLHRDLYQRGVEPLTINEERT